MTAMSGIDQLLVVANAYANAERISLSTVSSRVFDDSKKLPALARGIADIQVKRLESAMQWFADHWPQGARWPKGVRRPARREAAA
jgi:hypothetical protein